MSSFFLILFLGKNVKKFFGEVCKRKRLYNNAKLHQIQIQLISFLEIQCFKGNVLRTEPYL